MKSLYKSGNCSAVDPVQNRCHIITIILIKLARVSMKNLRQGGGEKNTNDFQDASQPPERAYLERVVPRTLKLASPYLNSK